MDTDDAPACQRTDFPAVNSPTRYSACVAVIHVCMSLIRGAGITTARTYVEREGAILPLVPQLLLPMIDASACGEACEWKPLCILRMHLHRESANPPSRHTISKYGASIEATLEI